MRHHALNRTCLVTFLALGLSFFPASFAEDVFKCPEQFGYYPDMQDCTKYYICVFGDSLHEKCTGGLFFSVELQTCDWPRNVECANGLKPGKDVVPEFPVEDEVFSSSRRTSATASSGSSRSQRPLPPNKESVSNYQTFDETDDRREFSRNSGARSQDQQRSKLPTSAATPSPAASLPQTSTPLTAATQSPTQHESQTSTYSEGGQTPVNGVPSTVSEDPLYANDDQSKISSPLDNYDPQQPEYEEEAVPPIVDSEGGIHIPDGGHGFDAFGGLSHLPGLGDYSVFAKPIYNAGDPREGGAGDHDYTDRDQRNKNNPSSPTATKPRNFESGSNNGQSKDPDVVIDYGNKEINDYNNHRDRQKSYATPPPTIFDDNADHRDYGKFDIITPIGSNTQAKPDSLPQNPKREQPPQIYSNSGNGRDTDAKQANVPVRIPNTEKRVRDRGTANDEIKSSLDIIRDQQDYRRLNQNGEIIESNKAKSQSNAEFDSFSNRNKQGDNRNSDYSSVDAQGVSANHGTSRDQRPNPNAAVDFDTFEESNNGNRGDPDAIFLEENFRVVGKLGNSTSHYQRRPIHDQDPNRDRPNLEKSHSGSRNSESDSAVLPNDRFRGDGYSPSQTGDRNREIVLQIDPKLSAADKTPGAVLTLHEIRNSNGQPKHSDDSYHDISDEDFGAYTGERQGRKLDTSGEAVQSQGVLNPSHKAISNPDVQQAGKPRQPPAKDSSGTKRDPPQFDESDFSDQYESEVHRGYGEYDSPRPHFTEDYYTNDDPETTTRTTTTARTTQAARTTRPTRPPRRTTTTQAPTTTVATTSAPIRVRTRRPLTQVTRSPSNKPAYMATTPASPPNRPVAVHPTPQPLTPAQKCDPRKCILPDCRCGGTDIPGGLPTKDIPQIVLLTFDDAVNDLNHDLYNELFNTGRANPNGCPILGTFYVSHEWTDYGQVQSLYSYGHEIASHSITHSYGEKFSKNQWLREIHGQREILHMYGGVKMEDIRGMRAPFLQIGGNKMFEMLFDANFTYDSSMPVYENNPPFWPYTLDYSLSHECMIFPCPTKSFAGLWEVGMIMWVDLRGGRCSMGDACSNPADEEAVTKMLLKNFNRHYKTNRAPFGLFYHSAWFNTQHHRRGFMKFLDEILQNDDVWLVTNWQAIQWIREPTPSSKMKDFEPFNCRRLDRPPPCPSPTVCNVWYQGGVRYMKTCQPCPAKYPWVGNTGYDGNSRG